MSDVNLHKDKRILFLSDHYPFKPNNNHEIWGTEPAEHFQLAKILKAMFKDVILGNSIEEIIHYRKKVDLVISALYGSYNESPWLMAAGLCETLNIPILGTPTSVLLAQTDKHIQKMMLAKAELPTPNWKLISKDSDLNILKDLPYPQIIKWRHGHNSYFIDDDSVVYSFEEAIKQIKFLWNSIDELIIEEFIDGINLTMGAIGPNSCETGDLVEIATRSKYNIQSFKMKHDLAITRQKKIYDDENIQRLATSYSVKIFEMYKPFDFMRVDFRYDKNTNDLKIIEHNIYSNYDPDGSFHLSLKKYYPRYEDLIFRLLESALARSNLNSG